jgi:cell division protein FtsI/penicillin-binding protein 2
MQMGGGQLDKQGRDVWHDYMVNHFQLGKPTGVEQGYEDPGYVPSPENNGAGINLTYANTAFGQAMTATPLQMAAALSSVLNGGTYYKPTLVAQTINPTTGEITVSQPKVVEKNVVSAKVGKELIPLMQYVVDHHYIKPSFDQSKYTVGGKTGTAQIAKPGGGYYDNIYNGTYLGFVGGNKVQYVIAVFVNRPQLPGWEFAGTAAAQPVFADLAHMLINNSYVTPKN